jgi:hypothetical protein
MKTVNNNVNGKSNRRNYPFMWIPGYSSTTANNTISTVADEIRFYPFNLAGSVTVRQISYRITAAAAGSLAFGVYTVAGDLIFQASGLSTASTGVFTATITPVTLDAGVYILAWTVEATTISFASVGVSTQQLIWDTNEILCGTAGTASTPGVLPATLGTRTAASIIRCPFLVIGDQ